MSVWYVCVMFRREGHDDIPCMDQRSQDEGFTLVELLVVILIIGFLAAIAIPTFLHQRQRSYEATMESDLHAAIIAENAYGDGHGGFVDDLATEGYRTSRDVTPVHVKLVGESFVACVKHTAAPDWLVYDGASGDTSSSASDCA